MKKLLILLTLILLNSCFKNYNCDKVVLEYYKEKSGLLNQEKMKELQESYSSKHPFCAPYFK
jgi:hypothetical protein